MRGVSKHGNKWRVSFGSIVEQYETESEAKARRQYLNNHYELKAPMKDYTGWQNENFEVLGYANDTYHGMQRVLVYNKHTKSNEVRTMNAIKNGHETGIPKQLSHLPRGTYWNKQVSKWTAKIVINKHQYHLGNFSNLSDAIMAYSDALKNWVEHNITPKPLRKNKLGEKYICFDETSKRYMFYKTINGKHFKEYFSTLSDAIAYKHKFLKEHGLTE